MIVILFVIILFLLFGVELGEAAQVVLHLVELLLAGAEAVTLHHSAHGDGQCHQYHRQRQAETWCLTVFQHKIDHRGTENQHVGGYFI